MIWRLEMETKFTKGPWHVKDGVVVCCGDSGGYSRVAYAYSGHSIPYTSEILSNAHIIAAAPEMYEILIQLQIGGGLGIARHRQIEKLLAKARGEQ